MRPHSCFNKKMCANDAVSNIGCVWVEADLTHTLAKMNVMIVVWVVEVLDCEHPESI